MSVQSLVTQFKISQLHWHTCVT